jgi:hypothetical protein
MTCLTGNAADFGRLPSRKPGDDIPLFLPHAGRNDPKRGDGLIHSWVHR